MAKRRKREEVEIATDTEVGRKVVSIRLELDETDHLMFRVMAAKRGMSMSALARQLVLAVIHKDFPPGSSN